MASENIFRSFTEMIHVRSEFYVKEILSQEELHRMFNLNKKKFYEIQKDKEKVKRS